MTEIQKTDEEIVLFAREQKEFFGILVQRYEAKLARYIKRLGVRDEEDVLDVLQEVFLKAYKNLFDFDTSLKFSSWIYRIAHNEAVSWYRKQSVRPEGHLVNDGEMILMFTKSEEWGSEELFDKTLDSEEMHKALYKISDKYRDIIILRFFEHKEYDEISDILKIPIGTVGTQIFRAKKKLAQHLKLKAEYVSSQNTS